MDGGAAGTPGDTIALQFGEEEMVGGDMDIFLLRGECGGGGNLPEDSKLGIMLPLLLLLFSDDSTPAPATDCLSLSPSTSWVCSSNVFATGEAGLGCMVGVLVSSSRSRLSCCCIVSVFVFAVGR